MTTQEELLQLALREEKQEKQKRLIAGIIMTPIVLAFAALLVFALSL